jgi:uncharacterized protein YxjI
MRYLVRERIFSITDDFWITDESGDKIFLVDGKALRLRETFELKDREGTVLATIRKRLLAFRDTMDIEHNSAVAATVRKAFFSPFQHRYLVDLADGTQLEAVGNFVDKEWEITGPGGVIGRISRQWFRIRDTYGVDVAPGENDALVISIAVCIDRIHEDEEKSRHRGAL